MSFLEDMAGHDDEFKQAEPPQGPPLYSDGKHEGILTLARVEKNNYGWQLVLGFRGIDANSKAQASIRKWHGLPPEPERMDFVAADLELLGYDFRTMGLSGIEAACIAEEWIGTVVAFGVVTKTGAERDYTNVYLNRNLGKRDMDEYLATRGGSPSSGEFVPAATSGAVDDDDIPF